MFPYHWNNIRSHVWKPNTTGMQGPNKQLSVFVGIFMLCHIISLNDFFLQNNHKLQKRSNEIEESHVFFQRMKINVMKHESTYFTSSTFLEETRSRAS